MVKGIFLLLSVFAITLSAISQTAPDSVKVDSLIDSAQYDSIVKPNDSLMETHAVESDSLEIKDTTQLIKEQKNLVEKADTAADMHLLKDSIANVNEQNFRLKDSLHQIHSEINILRLEADSIRAERNLYADSIVHLELEYDSLEHVVAKLKKKNELLRPLNRELSDQIQNLQNKVDSQSVMLDRQIQKIKEKEQLYAEKELIYQKAIQESKIDLVKLEGQLAAKNSQLSGKEREIELLAESISDRKDAIQDKNEEIRLIRDKRQSASVQLDTLKDYLRETEKDLLLTKQELKYSKKEIKALKKRIHDLTNKEKTIRLVQGIGIRNYRSPLYSLKPESSDNPDSYVITNENAGDYEFDFVTGATFKLFDLSADDAKFTSDVGFFLGFGGKNLFKNFYIGPNIKLFDVIHINAGLNVAEFRSLKSGFNEGDRVPQGSSIPTVSQWELTPYFGLTFDFSLITSIAGKL